MLIHIYTFYVFTYTLHMQHSLFIVLEECYSGHFLYGLFNDKNKTKQKINIHTHVTDSEQFFNKLEKL